MKTVTGREEFMFLSQIPRYFEDKAEDCKSKWKSRITERSQGSKTNKKCQTKKAVSRGGVTSTVAARRAESRYEESTSVRGSVLDSEF